MGVTLVGGGATFRFWAPRASEVYLNGTFNGAPAWAQTADRLMQKRNGHWTAFVPGVRPGDEYKFYVVGAGSRGYKRDPYARELTNVPAFPSCNCIVQPASPFPWSDGSFVTPDYADMVVYQLHVGTYRPRAPGAMGTFLDVVERIEYLSSLGINVLQLMPVDEAENRPTMGYNGADYFSPDSAYVVYDPAARTTHLATINRLRGLRGVSQLSIVDITPAPNQLKALVDCCHLFGIAVVFDVVYNHAGGFVGDGDAIYFEDRAVAGNNNDSLYFTDQGWAGGLSFALWNQDVRQFLINSARSYLEELHVDGLRYDEISALLRLNGDWGVRFCRDLTSTVRFLRPRSLQNAEFWPDERSIARARVVEATDSGGLGFDVVQHDALRIALRDAVSQASNGASAFVNVQAIAGALHPPDLARAWQAVTCIENHDIVKIGASLRIPRLADGNDARSWYARSRSRVAAGILMTAPGIPQLFMGQEVLEDKQWSDDPKSSNLIYWTGLDVDKAMQDHLRFLRELVRLRWSQRALRGDQVRPFHVHDLDRVLAYHRWLEREGNDVVVVASFNERTFWGYEIGFPRRGSWFEVFNSDVYDNWVNPITAGNGGQIFASGRPLHGFETSCSVVIPANAVVVFALQR